MCSFPFLCFYSVAALGKIADTHIDISSHVIQDAERLFIISGQAVLLELVTGEINWLYMFQQKTICD